MASSNVGRKYLIVAYVFYLLMVFVLIVAGGYMPIKIVIPVDDTIKIFTDEEIAKYDGSKDGLPIYMGIKGVVFDVSAGDSYYGKGRRYNSLVGRDSSRAVAKMSLDPADLTSDISGLDDKTLESLDDTYSETYLPKYPIVGYMQYLVTASKSTAKEDL